MGLEDSPLRIVVDTRERNPFRFDGYPCVVERGTLGTGDYSLRGFGDSVSVERKSLDDLVGCLGRDRDRFMREMERMRGYKSKALVVESPFNAVSAGFYRGSLNPESAVQSLVMLMQRYSIPVFFAFNRREAEFFAFHFLRHFRNEEARRLKALECADCVM